MMAGCAVPVRLSGGVEYVHCAASASDERSEKDAEILALRHQVRILRRQLGVNGVRFEPADRALLAALLGTLPRRTLRRLQLVGGDVTGVHQAVGA